MPAIVLHPLGAPPLPATFASYGTCAAGENIGGRLQQAGIPVLNIAMAQHQDNTSWIVNFVNVAPGHYDLVILTNGNPGPPIPIDVLIPPPPERRPGRRRRAREDKPKA